MESLLASEPWKVDATAIPIPWRKDLATPPADRKLKLGVIFDDGVVKPQPPVARAMRETVEALRAAGHEGKVFQIAFLCFDQVTELRKLLNGIHPFTWPPPTCGRKESWQTAANTVAPYATSSTNH